MTAPSLREAATMALEALESIDVGYRTREGSPCEVSFDEKKANSAIETLRAAIALPDAEPDRWTADEVKDLAARGLMAFECKICGCYAGAAPVERKPLTRDLRTAMDIITISRKVSVSEVQRKMAISYEEAHEICQSIVNTGLADGLPIAPSLHRAHGIKGAAC